MDPTMYFSFLVVPCIVSIYFKGIVDIVNNNNDDNNNNNNNDDNNNNNNNNNNKLINGRSYIAVGGCKYWLFGPEVTAATEWQTTQEDKILFTSIRVLFIM